ncbi:MAG: hypothetical protein ABS55_01070 [Lautropia sp. SCN 70-15]|jgi:uncharacterized OB-fold protein|nr:MAG: hypothetical protein ABS55_01070 [Lautropia sp. SCN 70-15]
MIEKLPSPVVNPDSAPYWNAAREGKLLVRKCRACGEFHFMPRYLCPKCWSHDLDWVEATGKGVVHSFSIVRRAPAAAFGDRVPYVVALIDLEEGPRMMANVVGEGALDTRIGDEVRVVFEDRGDGARIPQFVRGA